jgi:16S rRNA C967 or C1407 C5-methylase (RsmB/RsmF family)
VHQCRRLSSASLVVTVHKGQEFPAICTSDTKKEGGYFDRVLCDVPCSGDGTLRKNPMIWAKWGPQSALTLHPLQLMIAMRGLQLLKVSFTESSYTLNVAQRHLLCRWVAEWYTVRVA